jgi:hypothetical protein
MILVKMWLDHFNSPVGWVGLITVGSTELAPISVPFPNLISYPWFTEI